MLQLKTSSAFTPLILYNKHLRPSMRDHILCKKKDIEIDLLTPSPTLLHLSQSPKLPHSYIIIKVFLFPRHLGRHSLTVPAPFPIHGHGALNLLVLSDPFSWKSDSHCWQLPFWHFMLEYLIQFRVTLAVGLHHGRINLLNISYNHWYSLLWSEYFYLTLSLIKFWANYILNL